MATKKAATKKRTTTKRSTTKKATSKTQPKDNGQTDVTFTEDIPKVTREFGGSRTSKYDTLLDTLVERAEAGKSSTARMVFDTVGQSTSRYQSIKSAIEKREDDAHKFDVAQRTEQDDNDEEIKVVYAKYDPEAPEPEDTDSDESNDEDDAEF